MLCIRRLIVMDWPETPMTDAALAAHCTQPRTVLAPQLAVGIARIAHAAHPLLMGKSPHTSVQTGCSLRLSGTPRGFFQGRGICRMGRV